VEKHVQGEGKGPREARGDEVRVALLNSFLENRNRWEGQGNCYPQEGSREGKPFLGKPCLLEKQPHRKERNRSGLETTPKYRPNRNKPGERRDDHKESAGTDKSNALGSSKTGGHLKGKDLKDSELQKKKEALYSQTRSSKAGAAQEQPPSEPTPCWVLKNSEEKNESPGLSINKSNTPPQQQSFSQNRTPALRNEKRNRRREGFENSD